MLFEKNNNTGLYIFRRNWNRACGNVRCSESLCLAKYKFNWKQLMGILSELSMVPFLSRLGKNLFLLTSFCLRLERTSLNPFKKTPPAPLPHKTAPAATSKGSSSSCCGGTSNCFVAHWRFTTCSS